MIESFSAVTRGSEKKTGHPQYMNEKNKSSYHPEQKNKELTTRDRRRVTIVYLLIVDKEHI